MRQLHPLHLSARPSGQLHRQATDQCDNQDVQQKEIHNIQRQKDQNHNHNLR
jgi:hypothetical protein